MTRVARGTLPSLPAAFSDTLDAVIEAGESETLDEELAPSTAPRMTIRPPRVTTTTPGVMQKVLPR